MSQGFVGHDLHIFFFVCSFTVFCIGWEAKIFVWLITIGLYPFSKCDHICSYLEKYLSENFIFCAVCCFLLTILHSIFCFFSIECNIV